MPANIITTDDLRDFKIELLEEFKELLAQQASGTIKKYLRSSEVMKILQISPGTLQNLRLNGTLPYSKVGGLLFYEARDIQEVLNKNRVEYQKERL